jgi:hypothetical protein
MRQLNDTLVWLGVILVLAAVVYFTPRFANLVSAVQDQQYRTRAQASVLVHSVDATSEFAR